MPKLILVRHGQTDYNAQRRYQGHTDIPLNEMGLRQARALQKRLSHLKLTAAFCSDLSRARTTAQIGLEGHSPKLEAEILPGLREASGGRAEGLNYNQMLEQFPEETKLWQSDRYNYSPPGGENLKTVLERVSQAIDYITNKHPGEDEVVLVVAHGGVIGTLLCHYMGMDLNRIWQWRVDSCSLSIVHLYDNASILSLFNDTSHIDSMDLSEGK
ncbi:MAG: histidine phosphatase family protein [Chloroflexi bacterium]|uniref:Histidine phosphatase family protein n=1 Tax=Candidatus Chlorohelix allophototropha TaxID=3003348 RepID=A0A8T7LRM0_9CHLR|nr:histidine phosphatase family protein [Chloroflexota bacterium]WJW66562.1 histidine phosphatase family protein [Chloroflexota bacterium L227-S17]